MSLVVFLLLAVLSAVVVAYPLLPGRTPQMDAPSLTDADIEQAVRRLRRARHVDRGRLACPACGHACRPGDRFCVSCGSALTPATPVGTVCPACGADVRAGDRFCARCGQVLSAEEVA